MLGVWGSVCPLRAGPDVVGVTVPAESWPGAGRYTWQTAWSPALAAGKPRSE